MNAGAFSRVRKLSFQKVVGLLLQKSVKSLQVKLNEFFFDLALNPASASAFSQARANLSHAVFIELNTVSYAQAYYETPGYKTYKDFRLLAVDGSRIQLPDSEVVRLEFGERTIKNQHDTVSGSYTSGLCSVLYDVLNEIVVDGVLAPDNASEIALAIGHSNCCQESDLILFDRNYAGYQLFSELLSKKADFICRCSSNAFGIVIKFIANPNLEDIVVILTPNKDLKSKVSRGELPTQLQIRLVKVLLSTGEIEILATSLLDQQQYPIADFKELYAMRWNVETLYDRFKNRLALENFTGQTVEAVKQDFYSTLLISNIESELTAEADEELQEKQSRNKYPQKVNQTISFNLIKTQVFDLLFSSDIKSRRVVKKITEIFKKNPIPIRAARSYPRATTFSRARNFYRKSKKHAY